MALHLLDTQFPLNYACTMFQLCIIKSAYGIESPKISVICRRCWQDWPSGVYWGMEDCHFCKSVSEVGIAFLHISSCLLALLRAFSCREVLLRWSGVLVGRPTSTEWATRERWCHYKLCSTCTIHMSLTCLTRWMHSIIGQVWARQCYERPRLIPLEMTCHWSACGCSPQLLTFCAIRAHTGL